MFNLAHTVERSIVLDAPGEEVWEAVTDEATLRARLGLLRPAPGRLGLA